MSSATSRTYPCSVKKLVAYLKEHPRVKYFGDKSGEPETRLFLEHNEGRLRFLREGGATSCIPLFVCDGAETGVRFHEKGFTVTKFGMTMLYEYLESPFAIGRIVVTPDADSVLFEHSLTPATFLFAHAAAEWGAAPAKDKQANLLALVNGGELVSLYRVGSAGTTLLVVTDADRVETTVMLPVEFPGFELTN